ncbi:hypothetical protein ABZ820_12865 [Streptomyces diacarni]|uniref:hypothetical protein n=1 Tax=Streptomyces diacarni TaxID=2800381 RepID=UPI0033FA98BC
MRPTTDSERILGQIERGEVLAGREAARRIAARHEEAYGDVWRTAPAAPAAADDAWADAIHALTDDDTAGGIAA